MGPGDIEKTRPAFLVMMGGIVPAHDALGSGRLGFHRLTTLLQYDHQNLQPFQMLGGRSLMM
jgi:hypothetical protein